MSLGRVSGCSNTANWTRDDVLDLQRAMSMKISVKKWKDLQPDDDGRETGENW